MTNHVKEHINGTITVELEAKDWVWLCELLAEIKNDPDMDQMCLEDTSHALSALQSFEAGA